MHDGIQSCIHKLYQLTGKIDHVDVTDKAVIKIIPHLTFCVRVCVKDKMAPATLIFGFKDKPISIDFTVCHSFKNTVPNEQNCTIMSRKPKKLVINGTNKYEKLFTEQYLYIAFTSEEGCSINLRIVYSEKKMRVDKKELFPEIKSKGKVDNKEKEK